MQKEIFSSRIGYILTMAGTSIGVGNIWRFPYQAAQNGGGAFLLVYAAIAFTFGYTLVLIETCVGRMTGMAPIGAYKKICLEVKPSWRFLKIGGWINMIALMILTPYYFVICSWLTYYLYACFRYPIAKFAPGPESYSAQFFDGLLASWPIQCLFLVIFILLVAVVIARGLRKGIEKCSLVMMPILGVLLIGLVIYVFTIPGSWEGVKYYLHLDFEKFTYNTFVAAALQAIYSLSVGLGVLILFGSYMKQEDNISSNVNWVVLSDTAAAFLAGMMIIPAVVAFGGIEAANNAGPKLIFGALPEIFASLPQTGQFVAIAFFLLMFFTIYTSGIALYEVQVCFIIQKWPAISRKQSIAIVAFCNLFLGMMSILGYNLLKNVHPLNFVDKYKDFSILDTFDFLVNGILIPVGALFIVLTAIFVIKFEKIAEYIESCGDGWKRKRTFKFCMNFVVIPVLIVILLNIVGII